MNFMNTAYRLFLLINVFYFHLSIAAALEGAKETKPDRIEDNSFLIEEAYNQGPGVVQHINTWQYSEKERTWDYTFTQEWPFLKQTHQLSYTVPVSRVRDPETKTGLKDILLHYRYQLVNKDAVALSPRLSLILPTGDKDKGLGGGDLGYQVGIPISVELGESWVSHWNLGATFNPHEHDAFGNAASTTSFNYGASVVYLLSSTFNFMLEAVGTTTEVVGEKDSTSREDSFVLNPGFRLALNFPSGLQIVPGLSVPIGLGPSEGEYGVFGYLSFEHPF